MMSALVKWSWVFAVAGFVLIVGGVSGWYLTGWMALTGTPLYLMVSGSVLLLIYSGLDFRNIGEAARDRTVAQATTSLLLTVLMGLFGLGLYYVSNKYDKIFDVTQQQRFSLSDQSARVVGSLPKRVKVLAFFRNNTQPAGLFADLWAAFSVAGVNADIQWVDPLVEPIMAEKYEIEGSYGTVVLEVDGQRRVLEMPITEQELTNGLLMASTDKDHRICWSLGHGEPDPDDEYRDRGLGSIVLTLEDVNFSVSKTRIASEGIDRDCEVLLIARPQNPFFEFEQEAITAYVAEGGNLLVLLEATEAPEFAAFLLRFGVKAAPDMVLDLNDKNRLLGVSDPSFVVLSEDNLLSHPITYSLAAAVVLPQSGSVEIEAVDGLKSRVLLQTGPDAWAETTPYSEDVGPDPHERRGDVPLAVVTLVSDPAALNVVAPSAVKSEEPSGNTPLLPGEPTGAPNMNNDLSRAIPADFTAKAGGRVVVFGDSDFANNLFYKWGNNNDIFLNTLAWLVDEMDQLGERPEPKDQLELTASGSSLICLVSVLFVPGATVLFALLTLRRRRRL